MYILILHMCASCVVRVGRGVVMSMKGKVVNVRG